MGHAEGHAETIAPLANSIIPAHELQPYPRVSLGPRHPSALT
jgi:hypothetical protein